MPIKQDFEYNMEEAQKRVDSYFNKCEEVCAKPSDAGLCIALELPYSRMLVLSDIGDEYLAINPGLRADYRKERASEITQWGHIEILKKALLRVQDQLAGRTDTNAIFARKQKHLGRYTDRPSTPEASVSVSIKLEGAGKGDAFG